MYCVELILSLKSQETSDMSDVMLLILYSIADDGKWKAQIREDDGVSCLHVVFCTRMLFQFQYPPFSKEVDTENKGTW